MALRFSTALRQFRQQVGSTKQALIGGELRIYSGSQPADADTAPSGTLLNTITAASGARTAEVLSSGTVTLTGGASGTVDTLTVNSVSLIAAAVSYNTDLTTTAVDLAAAINDLTYIHKYTATSSGAVVTIKALPGMGTTPNGYVVACGSTTITNTPANMASGVAVANGLDWGVSAAGVLGKGSGTWSGSAVATGTAGWFRFTGSIADAGGASTVLIRMDGNIATSGSNLDMASTSIASGTTTTIDAFTLTDPAA